MPPLIAGPCSSKRPANSRPGAGLTTLILKPPRFGSPPPCVPPDRTPWREPARGLRRCGLPFTLLDRLSFGGSAAQAGSLGWRSASMPRQAAEKGTCAEPPSAISPGALHHKEMGAPADTQRERKPSFGPCGYPQVPGVGQMNWVCNLAIRDFKTLAGPQFTPRRCDSFRVVERGCRIVMADVSREPGRAD